MKTETDVERVRKLLNDTYNSILDAEGDEISANEYTGGVLDYLDSAISELSRYIANPSRDLNCRSLAVLLNAAADALDTAQIITDPDAGSDPDITKWQSDILAALNCVKLFNTAEGDFLEGLIKIFCDLDDLEDGNATQHTELINAINAIDDKVYWIAGEPIAEDPEHFTGTFEEATDIICDYIKNWMIEIIDKENF